VLGVAAALVVIALAVVVLARDRVPSHLEPETLGVLDPDTGRIVTKLPAPERPTAVAGGRRSLWLASGSGTVSRVDLRRPVPSRRSWSAAVRRR
jgi:hypothetical protein